MKAAKKELQHFVSEEWPHPFTHLPCTHLFRGKPDRLKIAMLTAYFDETGLSSAEKVCIVAGFVGNEAQWTSFAADWIPALGNHRKNLHMRKLRWNNDNRYPRIVSDLAQLGAIPGKYNLTPVFSGIMHQDYEELAKGKVREKYTNPYMTCAQTCMATTMKFVVGRDDEAVFIFDRQEGRRAEAMERLHEIVFQWAKFDPRLKDIQFMNHEKTVCLDPADYLTFAMRENIVNGAGKKAKASLPILAPYEKWRDGVFTRQQVANMTKRAIAAGMVPGGGPVQITPDFASALAQSGWSAANIQKLTEHLQSLKSSPLK